MGCSNARQRMPPQTRARTFHERQLMNDNRYGVFAIGASVLMALVLSAPGSSLAQGAAAADCSRIQRWIASGARSLGSARADGASGQRVSTRAMVELLAGDELFEPAFGSPYAAMPVDRMQQLVDVAIPQCQQNGRLNDAQGRLASLIFSDPVRSRLLRSSTQTPIPSANQIDTSSPRATPSGPALASAGRQPESQHAVRPAGPSPVAPSADTDGTVALYDGPPRFQYGTPERPDAAAAAARLVREVGGGLLSDGSEVLAAERRRLFSARFFNRECLYEYLRDGQTVSLASGLFWASARPELSKRFVAAQSAANAPGNTRVWDVVAASCPATYGEAMTLARGEMDSIRPERSDSVKGALGAGERQGLRFGSRHLGREAQGTAVEPNGSAALPAAALLRGSSHPSAANLRRYTDLPSLPPELEMQWTQLGGQQVLACNYSLAGKGIGGVGVTWFYFWHHQRPAGLNAAAVKALDGNPLNELVDVAVDRCPVSSGLAFVAAQGPGWSQRVAAGRVAQEAIVTAAERERPVCERSKGAYASAAGKPGEPSQQQMCAAFVGQIEANAKWMESFPQLAGSAVGALAGAQAGARVAQLASFGRVVFPFGVPVVTDFNKTECTAAGRAGSQRCTFAVQVDYVIKREDWRSGETAVEGIIRGKKGRREGLFEREGSGAWTFKPLGGGSGGSFSSGTGSPIQAKDNSMDQWREQWARDESEYQERLRRDRERREDQWQRNQERCGSWFRDCGR